MKVLETFAGIGGFALAWERLGFEHVAMVEIDPFCQAVLRKHWPEVPIHGDIKTFSALSLRGRVDILTGGPPCQPASVAGKRKGVEDARWLWPEFLRVVREALPRWVVAENPPGIVNLRPHGLEWIIGELEGAGYEVLPVIVGADDVGAPHRRKRVWIVAHRESGGVVPRGRGGEGVRGSRDEAADQEIPQGRVSGGPDGVRGDGAGDLRYHADDGCGGGDALAHRPRDGQRGEPEAERADWERAGADGDESLAHRRHDQPEEREGADRLDGERAPQRWRELLDAGVGAGREPGAAAGASAAGAAEPSTEAAGRDVVAHGISDPIRELEQRVPRGRAGAVRDAGQAEPGGDGAEGVADGDLDGREGERVCGVPDGGSPLGNDPHGRGEGAMEDSIRWVGEQPQRTGQQAGGRSQEDRREPHAVAGATSSGERAVGDAQHDAGRAEEPGRGAEGRASAGGTGAGVGRTAQAEPARARMDQPGGSALSEDHAGGSDRIGAVGDTPSDDQRREGSGSREQQESAGGPSVCTTELPDPEGERRASEGHGRGEEGRASVGGTGQIGAVDHPDSEGPRDPGEGAAWSREPREGQRDHRASGDPGGTAGELPDPEGERRAGEGDGRDGGPRAGCDGPRWPAGSDVADATLDRRDGPEDDSEGHEESGVDVAGCGEWSHPRWPARPGEPQWEWEEPRLVEYGNGSRHEAWARPGDPGNEGPLGEEQQHREPQGRREEGRCEGPAQLEVGGPVARLPERLVRAAERRARRANREALKAYGNACVPTCVEAIGRAILAVERSER